MPRGGKRTKIPETTKKTSCTTTTWKWNLKKSHGILCERNAVKYEFIYNNKDKFPITLMCKILKVSRNAYYNYLKRKDKISYEDILLEGLIREIFFSSRQTYGSRRIKAVLEKNITNKYMYFYAALDVYSRKITSSNL